MSEEDSQSRSSQSTQDQNFLAPVAGGTISPSSTLLPRTPSPAQSHGDGGSTLGRSLHIARVVPTPRPATSSPDTQENTEQASNNYSSSDESESDQNADTELAGGDVGNGHHFGDRARHHQSFRLNAQERSQQRQARVIPNRYASIRLRTSKLQHSLHDTECCYVH